MEWGGGKESKKGNPGLHVGCTETAVSHGGECRDRPRKRSGVGLQVDGVERSGVGEYSRICFREP